MWEWKNDRWKLQCSVPEFETMRVDRGWVRPTKEGKFKWLRYENPYTGAKLGGGFETSLDEAQKQVELI